MTSTERVAVTESLPRCGNACLGVDVGSARPSLPPRSGRAGDFNESFGTCQNQFCGTARRYRAGNGRAGNGRAGNGRAGNGRAGNGRAGNGRAGDGRAGNGRAEQNCARHASAGHDLAG
uniref:Uncharacterized protein n=1 Tax=Schlesneria paludicola TaxID=360056 RepID=A0A7C4LKA9_9PLAN